MVERIVNYNKAVRYVEFICESRQLWIKKKIKHTKGLMAESQDRMSRYKNRAIITSILAVALFITAQVLKAYGY